MSDAIMSADDLISQARADLDASDVSSVLDACEAFYMSGFSDASSGDVECRTGHFYRVHRWIVVTNTAGFHNLETFDSEAEACERFDTLESEYSEWFGDDTDL